MKAIDKNNIEEHLFDYFEGNLKEDEKRQLKDFLNRHPEFQADHDAWKKSYVVEPPLLYPNADKLLKKGKFNKKVFWFLSTVTVGVTTALVLMFGDSASEKETPVIADVTNTAPSTIENNITKEQAPPIEIIEAPAINSPDKKEPVAFASNKPHIDRKEPKKETPEKLYPQIAEQQPKTQPAQNEKNISEAKLPAETSVVVPKLEVTETLLPEKPAPTPVISQEQLNDSTSIIKAPDAIKTDSVDTSKNNKKRNFKWKIKVIPVNNIGL